MLDRRAFILALGTFAVGTDAFVIAGILPAIGRDLSITLESAGLVVSVFAISYAIGSPIVAALSANWRRKTVLVGGLTTFAAANVLSAASPTLSILLATRVLAAISAGLFAPAAYALGSTLGPPEARGRTLAIVVAGFSSATVLGVPLGVLIGEYTRWRGTLIFVAVVSGLASLAIAWTHLPEPPDGQPTFPLADRLGPIRERRTIAVLLPFLIWSTATYALYTYVVPLLETQLSPTTIPALLFLFGVGGVAGNLLGGALYDTFGTTRPTRLCLVVLIAALASARSTSESLVTAGIALPIWAMSMAALYTLQQQRAIAIDPAQSNLRLALNNSAMYLGASIGSASGGIIILRASVSALPFATALMAAAGLLTLVLIPTPANCPAVTRQIG